MFINKRFKLKLLKKIFIIKKVNIAFYRYFLGTIHSFRQRYASFKPKHRDVGFYKSIFYKLSLLR